MPDYAEVAGCSTFRNNTATSPLYDSYGAYATTNLVRNANIFTNNFHNNSHKNSIYSAPTICHYNTNTNTSSTTTTTATAVAPLSILDGHNFAYSDTNYPSNKIATTKMNIIENKFDVMNNLNRSTTSVASASASACIGSNVAMLNSTKTFQSTPHIGTGNGIGTMKRNRLPKIGHCDKISFGGCDNGRSIEQPLFIKSKEDGSWTSVQNSSYHFTATPTKTNDNHQHKTNGSNSNNNIITNNSNSYNHNNNSNNNKNQMDNGNSGSQIYLSSFGKSDNV